MNILIANQQGIHPNCGGIENVSWNLAKEFRKRGHKVYFASTFPPYGNTESMPLFDNFVQIYMPVQDKDDAPENIEYLSFECDKLSIDIILNQSGNIKSFSRLLFEANSDFAKKTKVVSVLHFNPSAHIMDIEDSYFISERLGKNPLLWCKAFVRFVAYKTVLLSNKIKSERDLYRYIYDGSDAYVLLSDKFKDSFLKISKLASVEKLFAINNPIEINLQHEIALNKKKKILFVGRLVRSQKRPDRLLKIWAKICDDFPDWELQFLGDGSYRKYLEKTASLKKLKNIVFLGRKNPQLYYENGDILCVTSTCEGFGMVLLEAQQYGCIPMAYQSFESITDIIENEKDGILITPYKSKEYDEKLREFMTNAMKRNQLQYNCLKKDYSKFDIKNIANEWIQLFEKLKG